MKIEGKNFYLLNASGSKYIFNKEQEAIAKLKDIANEGGPDPEKTAIFKVNSDGEEWSIRQISWSKIAMNLLGGD